MNCYTRRLRNFPRCGTVAAELALVLPIFALFLVAISEFGHVFHLVTVMDAAAHQAARKGAAEGASSADVQTHAEQVLRSSIHVASARIAVKDASVFDDPTTTAASVDLNALPDIELSAADPQQLYIVHVQIRYEDVAIFPPFWAENLTLTKLAVMRRE